MRSGPLLLTAVGYLVLRVVRLERALLVDAKTGLRNAAGWHSEATRELARAQRSGADVAVLVIDVDRFRAINAARGHLGGDHVLYLVASCLREALRPFDVLGRMGGDEFVVLLADASPAATRMVAERLRAAIARRAGCTVSVGVACSADSAGSPAGLVAAADTALFAAKAAGGDTIRWAPPARPDPDAGAAGPAQPTRKPSASPVASPHERTTSVTRPGA